MQVTYPHQNNTGMLQNATKGTGHITYMENEKYTSSLNGKDLSVGYDNIRSKLRVQRCTVY
jgi:hypothetical protein